MLKDVHSAARPAEHTHAEISLLSMAASNSSEAMCVIMPEDDAHW